MSSRIYLRAVEELPSLIPDQLTVSVVGCGYIGTCIAAFLAYRGLRVFGIEKNEKFVEEINRGTTSISEPHLLDYVRQARASHRLEAGPHFDPIADSDIIIVTVGTPLDQDLAPDLRHVKSACESIGEHLPEGSVVMIKSTVPPLTTQGVLKRILEERSGLEAGKQFGLVCSPERLSEGRAIEELHTIPILVGGIDRKSAEIAAVFWHTLLGVETVLVENCTSAELVKLADNQWIDLNVALANEIALLCDQFSIDAFEVIRAANSLPKGQHFVNILAPSVGVGGYCLTKDPWFFHRLGQDQGIDLRTPVCSRTVNDLMPEISFRRVRECLENSGIALQGANVAILGVAFNNNTGDTRFTPAEPFIRKLEQAGCSVTVFDPLVSAEQMRQITQAQIGKDIFATVEGADLVACLAAHKALVDTPLEALKSRTNPVCWLFDGRHGFDPKKATEAGFLYTAIGCKSYGEKWYNQPAAVKAS